MRMPALFVGHGSPMNAVEENVFTKGWVRIAEKLPRPKVILSISAHWYTDGTRVNNDPAPKTIYDMYGFPKELYEIVYDAPGSPEVAEAVLAQLSHNSHPCVVDNSWGLDHGTWSVLHRMYPDRRIPVLQLSIDGSADAKTHFDIGRSLSELRDRGVMIFGSGNVVHNLRRVQMQRADGFDWAYEFDGYIRDHMVKREAEAILDHSQAGDCAKLAFPTPEHYDPLLYVLGASREEDKLTVFNEACVMGSVSMTSYAFHNVEIK